MVKHLLIGFLAAILVSGTEVLYLDVIHIPNPLIHPLLERIHGGEICGDGIRCPNIGGSNTVKR
jgi:hypothetical protein